MDLIYTNKQREDVGVVKDYSFDLAFGSDENDFELTLDVNNHVCVEDGLVYIEGTEYGGIVDKIGVVTSEDKLVYYGRTWHGILASKIIQPDAKKAYFTVSGDANEVISTILSRVKLTDLFEASSEASGLVISSYSFDRYIDAYSGLKKMLESVSGKLKFAFRDGKVVVSAHPVIDYSKDEQFDNDQVELTIEKTYNTINHLICLGKGELEDRQVVHLYKDGDGNISETQTFFDLEEIAGVYDYSSAESLDDLKKSGKEHLQEESVTDVVQMDFASEEKVYDIGDIIGSKEVTTGITAIEKITKKIVNISQGEVNIEYKVGEE